MDIPLEILDRQVASAARELETARARLARGVPSGEPNPLAFHRQVASRETYLELGDHTMQSPLAAPLRTWVAMLTLDRVLWRDVERLSDARHAVSILVNAPGAPAAYSSPRDLLRRLLGEKDPSRQRLLADALAAGSGAVGDAARILAERRAEAARLLGAPEDVLSNPIDPPAALVNVAERFLVETAQLVPRSRDWVEALVFSIGRTHGEGWPTHLVPRWIEDLFRGTDLLQGLRIALPPLPESLGPSSFARALGSFGAAFSAACAPASAPFVMARAPFDLRRARRSGLFAGLVADPVFGARVLGLHRSTARDQARGVAGALLLSLRLHAVRVLLRGVLNEAPEIAAARFEERTAEALGAPIPAGLVGVVPELGPFDAVRFAGAILSVSDRRALIEHFDEDWFRSPHAAQELREQDSVIALSNVAQKDALEEGITELVRSVIDLG